MTFRQPTADRRQFIRQPLSASVRVGKGDMQGANPVTVVGRTRDVNNKGVYLWARHDFQVGEVLHLQIEVPLNPAGNLALQVCCTAEILRIDPRHLVEGGVGLAVRILHFDTPQVLSQPAATN